MNAHSPGAYGISALIHGGVAALILFFSYAASSVVKDTPKVFELVAGAGDNYAATAAPALGSETGVKLEAAPVAQAETPPAPKAEESPIQPAPLEKTPVTKAQVPKATTTPKPAKPAKPVDLVASLKRAEMRRELNLEKKYKKEQEAEEKRQAAEAARAARVQHIDAKGIHDGVIGGSTENTKGGAGGRALTREEGSELDAYFALLLSRIKENHTPPEGVSDSLAARLEFFVAADGSLSHIRIVKSSGNHEFDRSVIEACERTRSIGARPDGRSETVQMTFKMHEDESQ
jgi:colicin import membrane protein